MKQENVTLKFGDLALLAVMEKHQGTPVSQRTLQELVPNWLARQGVPIPGYTRTMHQKTAIILSQGRLMDCGLIEPTGDRYPHDISGKGLQLLAALPDHWRDWPVELPFVNGKPDWPNANFPSKHVAIR